MFQCKTFIEAHEGTIQVESMLNAGTLFTIMLPSSHYVPKHKKEQKLAEVQYLL